MRTALVTLATLLAASGPAAALPGDPPITPLTPADGAAVPANPSGVPVTFTCPAYVIAVFSGGGTTITDRGDHEDYDVTFSDGPALGPNGRLASQPYGNTASARLNADGSTCTALLDTVDSARSPEITGGTIYWQASRSCTGCAGVQREFSPVRSFIVRPAAASGRLTAPPRTYAGYPALFTLRTTAPLSGGTVTLERRAGSRWRTLGTASFDTDGTPVVATLPAGRQTLRARVGALVVAQRSLTVLRGGARTTSARDDGAYGPAAGAPKAALRLGVTGGGMRLTGFRASVATLCPGATTGDNRFTIAFATLVSARIAPDGSVVGRLATAAGTRVLLTGRLRAQRFTGRVTLTLGGCTGERALVAVRR